MDLSPQPYAERLKARFGVAAPNSRAQAAPPGYKHSGLSPAQLAEVEARLLGTHLIDPLKNSPDPNLVDRFTQSHCLSARVLPWRRAGGRVIVLAPSLRHFLRAQKALETVFGPVHLCIVTESKLDQALQRLCASWLKTHSEARTPARLSCRNWNILRSKFIAVGLVLSIFLLLVLWPTAFVKIVTAIAVISLIGLSILKISAVTIYLKKVRRSQQIDGLKPAQMPIVSLLVPLLHETDIARTLINRLSQLEYPPDKLDICLILEADDLMTIAALSKTELPFWMRAIVVPTGSVQTKPRALNYALEFAKGTLIGVYDAEDAPEADQINKVATKFADCDPKLACLQGRLDFYNTQFNWLSRCFTLEYAAWFRVFLPGLQRLGFPVPLGGTTLFFRRDILEEIGGWDAHNVTEDADLGIRLARYGYRTEILETTTQEEANASFRPWIKQRSRWLKGYIMTYLVHMRTPLILLRELGIWKFVGFQMLFAGTIAQFLLAPVLWAFWILTWAPYLSFETGIGGITIALFLSAELLGICMLMLGAIDAQKPELCKWAPTLIVYFPFASLAAYRGLLELLKQPFHWQKTRHGLFSNVTDHP